MTIDELKMRLNCITKDMKVLVLAIDEIVEEGLFVEELFVEKLDDQRCGMCKFQLGDVQSRYCCRKSKGRSRWDCHDNSKPCGEYERR